MYFRPWVRGRQLGISRARSRSGSRSSRPRWSSGAAAMSRTGRSGLQRWQRVPSGSRDPDALERRTRRRFWSRTSCFSGRSSPRRAPASRSLASDGSSRRAAIRDCRFCEPLARSTSTASRGRLVRRRAGRPPGNAPLIVGQMELCERVGAVDVSAASRTRLASSCSLKSPSSRSGSG